MVVHRGPAADLSNDVLELTRGPLGPRARVLRAEPADLSPPVAVGLVLPRGGVGAFGRRACGAGAHCRAGRSIARRVGAAHAVWAAGPDTWLGPLETTSSLAQPPMFGHVIRVLLDHGMAVPAGPVARARRGLAWLWSRRRTDLDLLYVVHPWEAGNDHSPRWDSWGAPGTNREDYHRAARTAWNKARMADVSFHDDGLPPRRRLSSPARRLQRLRRIQPGRAGGCARGRGTGRTRSPNCRCDGRTPVG